ncbi:MAG: N-acetylmuramoyl-L-alanine amidase [Flavobacteriaceae bacterium]|nr:N-acetylmuramoyl-L-alanine amidase [Flavobacteriaceae bacterium]
MKKFFEFLKQVFSMSKKMAENDVQIVAEGPTIKKMLLKKHFRKGRRKEVSVVVYHYISAKNTNPADPFDLKAIIKIFEDFPVSAHYLIERDGTIIQLVEDEDTAWHAGVSNYGGESNVNDFAIGIEFVATHTSGFTNNQIESAIWLSKNRLMKKFPKITEPRHTGHEHIAPGRKIDPGPKFPWREVRSKLAA